MGPGRGAAADGAVCGRPDGDRLDQRDLAGARLGAQHECAALLLGQLRPRDATAM